jgi:glycosyltransferase involved in cell wall biosynthesis
MKILVAYPYVPYPLDRGTCQRLFHLIKELAAVHDIDFVSLAENGEGAEHADVFRPFCRSVEIIPFVHPPWPKLFPNRLLDPLPSNVAHWNVPAVRARLQEIRRAGRYDAIHVCDIVTAQFFLNDNVPLIVDRSRVDLQFQLAEHSRMNFPLRTRLLRCEGYAKLWFYERKVADRARMEIVCGPDDAAFLRRWVRQNIRAEVLVNGVDVDYFHGGDFSQPDPQPTLIFCGTMDYNPNIDALRWYFAEMHDSLRRAIPDLQVLVVGKAPVAEVKAYAEKPGVTVTGGVPDVRPYYRRAWLQMVPLRIGGGTRLKIVESLAIGTPVVSTSIGAQGLDLVHDQDILLADDSKAFVTQIIRALGDKSLRSRLAIAGMETARQRFSWKTIGQGLNALYSARVSARREVALHGHET